MGVELVWPLVAVGVGDDRRELRGAEEVIAVKTGVAGGRKLPLEDRHICGTSRRASSLDAAGLRLVSPSSATPQGHSAVELAVAGAVASQRPGTESEGQGDAGPQ